MAPAVAFVTKALVRWIISTFLPRTTTKLANFLFNASKFNSPFLVLYLCLTIFGIIKCDYRYSLTMSNFIGFSIFCASCKNFALLNTLFNRNSLSSTCLCLIYGEPSPVTSASLTVVSLHCNAVTSEKLQSLLNIFSLCKKSSQNSPLYCRLVLS